MNPLDLMLVYQCHRGTDHELLAEKISQNSEVRQNFRALDTWASGRYIVSSRKRLLAFHIRRTVGGLWRADHVNGSFCTLSRPLTDLLMKMTPELASQARLASMLELQDKINALINPKWREAGNPWFRAIWTECAELMDHIGWKWWKRQVPEIEQCRLELVDIFHFGLSDLLVRHVTIEAACAAAVDEFEELDRSTNTPQLESLAVLDLVEQFASQVLLSRSFSLASFVPLCQVFQLDGADLHRRYVHKNVLNIFRQDHGYKQGTYVKNWKGREDNEWLVVIASRIDVSPEALADELYRGLKSAYSEVIDG